MFSWHELNDEPLMLEFTAEASRYLVHHSSLNLPDTTLVLSYEQPHEAVIERTNNVLSRDEALANVELCRKSMVKELFRWNSRKAWQRGPRASAKNALASKWVLKWKMINGIRDIKSG